MFPSALIVVGLVAACSGAFPPKPAEEHSEPRAVVALTHFTDYEDQLDPFASTGVMSRDVPIRNLLWSLTHSNDPVAQKKGRALAQLIEGRRLADELFEDLVNAATVTAPEQRCTIMHDKLLLNQSVFPCYKKLLTAFATNCFTPQHTYFLQHYYKLANICLLNVSTNELLRDMPILCSKLHETLKNTVII